MQISLNLCTLLKNCFNFVFRDLMWFKAIGILLDSRVRKKKINNKKNKKNGLKIFKSYCYYYYFFTEVLFIGFVGEGMLTACIAGKMFSPPPAANILATIQSVTKLNKGKYCT